MGAEQALFYLILSTKDTDFRILCFGQNASFMTCLGGGLWNVTDFVSPDKGSGGSSYYIGILQDPSGMPNSVCLNF